MGKNRGLLTYVIIALIFIIAIWLLMPQLTSSKHTLQYSDVMAYFDEYKVTEYTLDLGSGELKYKLSGEEKEHTYEVPNVALFLQDTENYRKEYNEKNPKAQLTQDYFKVTDNSWLLTVVPTAVLMIMAIVLFVVMFRQANGGGKINSFGKANIKAATGSAKKATFADVAGADEEKAEMAELVDFLKNPKKFEDIGARIPRGVLLLGPPGTGKTLLARAVAGEAGVPFFPISGSDFVEMFVGVGASRVRDLFEQAKKHAPSSRKTKVSSSLRQRTAAIFWIRRCCVRADSTVRSRSITPMSRAERRSSRFTRAKSRSAPMSISTILRRIRRASPVQTSKIC